MVNVVTADCTPGEQLYHICIDIPEGRFASAPLQLRDGEYSVLQSTPHEVLNLDEFSSSNGWGEHPCTHDHVDGNLMFNFNKMNTDELPRANWSPRWTSRTHFFPHTEGSTVQGHWVVSSILHPFEEWIGLPMGSAAWHGGLSGDITPDHIFLTYGEAMYHQGHYEQSYGNFCVQYHLIRDYTAPSLLYKGTKIKGTIAENTAPVAIPGSPFNPVEEDFEVEAYVAAGQTAVDTLSQALQYMYRNGILDSIVLKAIEGKSVRELLLSPTGDAVNAMEPVTVLSSNNVENAIQASDIGGAIAPLHTAVDMSRNIKDPVTWVKGAGELFLWYKYVAKPTYQDVAEALDAYRTHAKGVLGQLRPGTYRSTSRSSHLGWECRTAARITLHPYAADCIERCLNVLDNVGLLPTSARLWDLIPYSFVADWVVNVQDCLRAIDTTMFSYRYQIDEVTTSTKATLRSWIPPGLDVDVVTCDGITFSFYHRSVGTTIPVDPTVNLRGLTTTGHTLAGSALLVCNSI